MTKIAKATTAMRLHSEGKLKLDAPIGTYLSGYQPDPEAWAPHDPTPADPHGRAREPHADPLGPTRGGDRRIRT